MITKIISGMQTGADITGLRVAARYGIPTGGWCTKGCRTDIGPKPEWRDLYGLEESYSTDYKHRTHLNAAAGDGTVWFGKITSPGFYCTKQGCMAAIVKRPMINNPTPEELRDWILKFNIKILNVAGNRERTNPSVVKLTETVLSQTLELLGFKDGRRPDQDSHEIDKLHHPKVD